MQIVNVLPLDIRRLSNNHAQRRQQHDAYQPSNDGTGSEPLENESRSRIQFEQGPRHGEENHITSQQQGAATLQQALRLATPMFISLSLISVISLTDIFLAGMIGSEAQAALGVADQIVFLNMLMLTGFCSGVNSVISQSIGAQKSQRVRRQIKHSLIISALLGSLATVIGLLTADLAASCFTSSETVHKQASDFISLCAWGNMPWSIVMTQGAILRATHNAQLCIRQWLVITIICVAGEIGCFLLMPGLHSIAPLAVSWDIAVVVGAIIGNHLTDPDKIAGTQRTNGTHWTKSTHWTLGWRGHSHRSPGMSCNLDILWNARSRSTIRRIYINAHSIFAIALPLMITDMCWLISNLILFSLLSRLPHATTAQAAWALQLKIEEAVAYVPLMAWCQAAATISGYHCGAGREKQARELGLRMGVSAAAVMFMVATITALSSPWITHLASHDPNVQQLSQQLLLGCLASFPINALALVLSAILEGAGSTVGPMVLNVVGLCAIRMPAAWLLGITAGLGVLGIWIAKILSSTFLMLTMILYIWKGKATRLQSLSEINS